MHTRLLFDHKSSMRPLYGILSPKRTKIKLRWYNEELPALFVTTTDAKQVSLKQRRANQRLIMLYKIVNNLGLGYKVI